MSRQPTWRSLFVLFGFPDGTLLASSGGVARPRAAFMETDRIDTGRSDNQRRQSGGEKGGMRHASLGRRCLLAACAAFLMGCLSPTLPMPPPAKPDIEGPDERGIFVLSGHVLPESHVYADNE